MESQQNCYSQYEKIENNINDNNENDNLYDNYQNQQQDDIKSNNELDNNIYKQTDQNSHLNQNQQQEDQVIIMEEEQIEKFEIQEQNQNDNLAIQKIQQLTFSAESKLKEGGENQLQYKNENEQVQINSDLQMSNQTLGQAYIQMDMNQTHSSGLTGIMKDKLYIQNGDAPSPLLLDNIMSSQNPNRLNPSVFTTSHAFKQNQEESIFNDRIKNSRKNSIKGNTCLNNSFRKNQMIQFHHPESSYFSNIQNTSKPQKKENTQSNSKNAASTVSSFTGNQSKTVTQTQNRGRGSTRNKTIAANNQYKGITDKILYETQRIENQAELINNENSSIQRDVKSSEQKARFRNINRNNYVNLSTAIPLRENQVNSLLTSEKFRRSLNLNDYLEQSIISTSTINKRRIFDGTSEKQLLKAMSSYLNKNGPGDYNLPVLIGDNIVDSCKKTNPKWTFQSRNKLSWFPERATNFQGITSPPSTTYNPSSDNHKFVNLKFSQSKNRRFFMPSHKAKIDQNLPIQYLVKEPGQDYHINKPGIGIGQKSDFMEIRHKSKTPAPNQYDAHIKTSISYLSKQKNEGKHHGFQNNYDKYDKICYSGMEQHFYLRETKGPGAYMPLEYIYQSTTKKPLKYTVPKEPRGVLRVPKTPGPTTYSPSRAITTVNNPKFKMSRATRDIPFSKYSQVHSELVVKGIV